MVCIANTRICIELMNVQWLCMHGFDICRAHGYCEFFHHACVDGAECDVASVLFLVALLGHWCFVIDLD